MKECGIKKGSSLFKNLDKVALPEYCLLGLKRAHYVPFNFFLKMVKCQLVFIGKGPVW